MQQLFEMVHFALNYKVPNFSENTLCYITIQPNCFYAKYEHPLTPSSPNPKIPDLLKREILCTVFNVDTLVISWGTEFVPASDCPEKLLPVLLAR